MPIPILAAVRSPFAAADGVLAGWHPVDLAVEIGTVALEQATVSPRAPSRSNRGAFSCLVSGMMTSVATMAAPAEMTGRANSSCQLV